MALVWLHGRCNLDFGPFSTVFRSPRFYPLKSVPDFRICSYRSEYTRFRVSHFPPDDARIRDPPIVAPVRYSYRITDLASSCARRTMIPVSARQPSISSLFCAPRREVADVFVFFHSFLYSFCYFASARGLTFVR
jgi:hypothetical protein